jgi:hypothetical protein
MKNLNEVIIRFVHLLKVPFLSAWVSLHRDLNILILEHMRFSAFSLVISIGLGKVSTIMSNKFLPNGSQFENSACMGALGSLNFSSRGASLIFNDVIIFSIMTVSLETDEKKNKKKLF